jgi:hypothetical protein
MGHESPIELWSPNLTTFCFVGFGTDRLRREQAMKTAGKENPNRCAITRQPTELLERRLELSLLNQAGWKARKHPATAKYFFLTFPFIELTSYLSSDERLAINLSVGHFLRHVQDEFAVFIFYLAEQTAQFVEETGFFANTPPGDIVGRFALGKIGKLGWLFSVVEELIEWALERASQFLERFNGWDGMAIFNAGDIAPK